MKIFFIFSPWFVVNEKHQCINLKNNGNYCQITWWITNKTWRKWCQSLNASILEKNTQNKFCLQTKQFFLNTKTFPRTWIASVFFFLQPVPLKFKPWLLIEISLYPIPGQGEQGGHKCHLLPPPQIWADPLTLSWPGEADYAHLIINCPYGFSDLPTALQTESFQQQRVSVWQHSGTFNFCPQAFKEHATSGLCKIYKQQEDDQTGVACSTTFVLLTSFIYSKYYKHWKRT